MALQFSVTARNARLDSVETTISTTPKLQIRTLAPPANCAAVDTGALLAEIDLPADWMNAASSGSKTKNGTWSTTAVGTGTAAHFRVKDAAGTVTHIQGTVTGTGGGGDMTLDNASIATGQTVTVNTFTITDGNA